MSARSRTMRVLAFVAVPPLLATSIPVVRLADVPLASLDLSKMRVQGGGGRGGQQTVAQANESIDGNPLRIGGKEFADGVGTRATSVLFVSLGGRADRFTAMVGADDNPIDNRFNCTDRQNWTGLAGFDAARLPAIALKARQSQ